MCSGLLVLRLQPQLSQLTAVRIPLHLFRQRPNGPSVSSFNVRFCMTPANRFSVDTLDTFGQPRCSKLFIQNDPTLQLQDSSPQSRTKVPHAGNTQTFYTSARSSLPILHGLHNSLFVVLKKMWRLSPAQKATIPGPLKTGNALSAQMRPKYAALV